MDAQRPVLEEVAVEFILFPCAPPVCARNPTVWLPGTPLRAAPFPPPGPSTPRPSPVLANGLQLITWPSKYAPPAELSIRVVLLRLGPNAQRRAGAAVHVAGQQRFHFGSVPGKDPSSCSRLADSGAAKKGLRRSTPR